MSWVVCEDVGLLRSSGVLPRGCPEWLPFSPVVPAAFNSRSSGDIFGLSDLPLDFGMGAFSSGGRWCRWAWRGLWNHRLGIVRGEDLVRRHSPYAIHHLTGVHNMRMAVCRLGLHIVILLCDGRPPMDMWWIGGCSSAGHLGFFWEDVLSGFTHNTSAQLWHGGL